MLAYKYKISTPKGGPWPTGPLATLLARMQRYDIAENLTVSLMSKGRKIPPSPVVHAKLFYHELSPDMTLSNGAESVVLAATVT